MSDVEAGHRILQSRANKLRHRLDRPLKRAHRADSFDDAADPRGAIIQHPTDRYESDEADSDAEADAEYQARMRRMRSSPARPSGGSSSVVSLKAGYESKMVEVNSAIRDLEDQMRKVDAKLKQMNQWKIKALKSKEFNPYEMLNYNSVVELVEPTKLRYYDNLIRQSVGRHTLRNFRLRKMVKHVHSGVGDILAHYIDARSGMLQQAQAEATHQETIQREERERVSQTVPETYVIAPGAGRYTHVPAAPAHLAPPINPITGLPAELPAFEPPRTTLVGSLTDDTVSAAPLSILTSAAALPQSERIQLQTELKAWLAHSQNVSRNGYRQKLPLPEDSPPGTLAEEVPTSVPELMSGLADAGPILRCVLEELLNGYAESQATGASFRARTKELAQRGEHAAEELAELDADRARLEAHLSRGVAGLARLMRAHRQARSLLVEHTRYESRLRKTHGGLAASRARREMDARRTARQEALRREGRSGPTGGAGVSAAMIAAARRERTRANELERAGLLQDILHQQTLAMHSVAAAAAEANRHAAAGRDGPSEYTQQASTKNDQSTAGLEELMALLEGDVDTPHLRQFVERKRAEIDTELASRGFPMPPPPPQVANDTAPNQARPASAAHARVASHTRSSSSQMNQSRPRPSSASLSPTRQQQTAANGSMAASSSTTIWSDRPFERAPPMSTLLDRLSYHNGLAGPVMQVPSQSLLDAAAAAVAPTVPLVAYPMPPTARPIMAPRIVIPARTFPPPQPVHIPTTLVGGLTPSVRAQELRRLQASPYLVSRINTAKDEMAHIDALGDVDAHAARPKKKTSARGTRPLKASLPASNSGLASAATTPRDPASSPRMLRDQVAHQKLRVEQTIHEQQLFDGRNC